MAANELVELAGNGRQNGYIDVVILNTGTVSTIADLEGFAVLGLLIPTITSATLTFQVAKERTGTYYTVKSIDASTAFTIAASTGACAVESNDLEALKGYRFIKIVAGASQGAERTLTFVVKG